MITVLFPTKTEVLLLFLTLGIPERVICFSSKKALLRPDFLCSAYNFFSFR